MLILEGPWAAGSKKGGCKRSTEEDFQAEDTPKQRNDQSWLSKEQCFVHLKQQKQRQSGEVLIVHDM